MTFASPGASLCDMPIGFDCPVCGGMLKVRDEHQGKKVKCPKCNQRVLAEPNEEDEPDDIPPSSSFAGCGSCLGFILLVLICIGGGVGSVYAADYIFSLTDDGGIRHCAGWTFYIIIPSAFGGAFLAGLMGLSVSRTQRALIESGDPGAIRELVTSAFPSDGNASADNGAKKRLQNDRRLQVMLLRLVLRGEINVSTAKSALEHIGDAARERLVDGLVSTERETRWRAAEALQELGWANSKKTRERVDALLDEMSRHRNRSREPRMEVNPKDRSLGATPRFAITFTSFWYEPITIRAIKIVAETRAITKEVRIETDRNVFEDLAKENIYFRFDDGTRAEFPLVLAPYATTCLSVPTEAVRPYVGDNKPIVHEGFVVVVLAWLDVTATLESGKTISTSVQPSDL